MLVKRGKNSGGKAMHNNLMLHHRTSSSASSSGSHSPEHHQEFKKRKNTRSNKHAEDEFVVADVVIKAIEMLKHEVASPDLPGFGKSPMGRQQRVDVDNHVDEAAEKFINRFYKNLMKQNSIDYYWGTPGR